MLLPFRSTITAGCVVALSVLAVYPAAADVHVRSYTRRDGTVVQRHMRSDPDGIFSNNWSTKGNVNPYTGKPGTRETTPSRRSSSYSRPPSYSGPSYASPRAMSGGSVVVPSYSSPYVPTVDDSASREAARRAAEAASAAEIAAAAKQYSDAKVQALATAKQNSDQRRRAFGAELESERSKAAADYEARKVQLTAEYEQNEPAAVESDKAELRITYGELIGRFNQEQIAEDERFKAGIEGERRQLAAAAEATEARSVAIFGRVDLSPAEVRDYLRRHDAIQGKIKEHNQHGWPDTTKSQLRATAIVRAEVANRIERRRADRDQRRLAVKAAIDQELGQRIAKLESDFERGESERFAADQERAERRFLAFVHGGSIDRALEAEPVAHLRPASSNQTSSSSGLALTAVIGLCLLLIVGAILSARSKTIDYREPPQEKRN